MKKVPNILTVIRIILVPIFVLMFFYSPIAAMCIFVAAFVTDAADGYIARKYDAVTDIGKVLDPLADKLMKLAALCCLAAKGLIPEWIFYVMLTFDLGMIITGAFMFKRKWIVPSNIVGKTGTFVLTVAIVLSLLKAVGINVYGVDIILLYCGLTIVALSIVVYGIISLNRFIVKSGKEKEVFDKIDDKMADVRKKIMCGHSDKTEPNKNKSESGAVSNGPKA